MKKQSGFSKALFRFQIFPYNVQIAPSTFQRHLRRYFRNSNFILVKKQHQKGALSKIAPKMSLERGRCSLNNNNSVFLLSSYTESFENEITALKIHFAFSFFLNACFLCKLKNLTFEFWNMSFQRHYFVFKAFPIRRQ